MPTRRLARKSSTKWYVRGMSDTFTIAVGNKGRIVVPAGVRERHSWHEGTRLIAVESASGLVLISRDEARRLLKEQLAGHDLVTELLQDRRAEAAHDAA